MLFVRFFLIQKRISFLLKPKGERNLYFPRIQMKGICIHAFYHKIKAVFSASSRLFCYFCLAFGLHLVYIDLPPMIQKFQIHRSHFLVGFAFIVMVLAIVKCVNPSVTQRVTSLIAHNVTTTKQTAIAPNDTIALHGRKVDSILLRKRAPLRLSKADGSPVKNRVTSVHRFETSFPDLNDIQLATARRLGVAQIKNREEAVKRQDELVYVGDCPFYTIQPLSHSIPYLTPRAATLLSEIGRAFIDSLATKGYPLHKLLVTSVLRTQDDVDRLRRVNHNASEQSCHQFGTTFDISYNRFLHIEDPEIGKSEIKWVTVFKSILAEVLEDQRLMGTCYVKYEYKQACFHITAR